VNVAVMFPWRAKEERMSAYAVTRAWYEVHLPEAKIVEVDTEHEVFNLAACRNFAVGAAEGLGADVVVISDADTIPPPSGLAAAIADADDHKLHIPFDRCIYAGTDSPPGLANGGVHVVTPTGWHAIGGQDERLVGWGGDDDQLVAVATCLSGLVRHPGLAVSLWHSDAARVCAQPSRDLVGDYWRLVDKPAAMRKLIAER
jgi:hypothetical protein